MSSPSSDRLQGVIDSVVQETMKQSQPRAATPPSPAPPQPRPAKARKSNVKKNVSRVSRNLENATLLNGSDSDSTFVPLSPRTTKASPSAPPPSKKRKREDFSTPSADFRVSVSIASGIDPVDFTMIKNCAVNDIDTVPKLRRLLVSHFSHELNALKAPEKLKLLVYRIKIANESEWTAITLAREYSDSFITAKANPGASIRLQVCVLEEDTMGMGRGVLLGRAAAKMQGEELEIGDLKEDEENAVALKERLLQQLEEIEMLKEEIKGLKGRLNEA